MRSVPRRLRTSDSALPTPHVPERMCAGCGRRAPKGDLARFTPVRDDDELVAVRDDKAVRAGRGIYTCRSRECFDRAVERRGFARGARGKVRVDVTMADVLGDERHG